MDLVIDFGTSYGKIAIFDNLDLKEKFSKITLEEIKQICNKFQIRDAILSSVSVDPDEIKKNLSCRGKVIILSHSLALPIQLEYDTPSTLGTDRIAAVAGAFHLFPDTDILVIDAGTCITYDFISAEGKYAGGSISPGMELKFKALHNYTKSLPLMNRVVKPELTGKSTGKSILSGVINGTIAEMNEISRMYRNKFPHLQLVICGGDAEFYSNHLQNDFQLVPDLVLIGLKTILDNNV